MSRVDVIKVLLLLRIRMCHARRRRRVEFLFLLLENPIKRRKKGNTRKRWRLRHNQKKKGRKKGVWFVVVTKGLNYRLQTRVIAPRRRVYYLGFSCFQLPLDGTESIAKWNHPNWMSE